MDLSEGLFQDIVNILHLAMQLHTNILVLWDC